MKNMNIKKQTLSLFYLVLNVFLFFNLNCANGSSGASGKTSIGKYAGVSYAVLSSLFNNRMLLLLKGTYATDSPISFADYNNGTGLLYQDNQNIGAGGDPTFDLFGLPTASSLNFFMDIGEIRISSNINKVL